MFSCVTKPGGRLLVLATAVLLPVVLTAQVVPSAKGSLADDSASKWDIFGGYSFFAPNSTVDGYSETKKQTPGPIKPVAFNVEKIGSVESLAYFFNKHTGLEFSSGQHDLYNNTNNAKGQEVGSSNSGLFTMQMGMIYRWREGRWTRWVHGLAGGVSQQGPDSQSYTPGETFTAGGGLDYELTRHWALRMAEGDYEYVHVNHGKPYLGSDHMDWEAGGVANMQGLRLAAGIVYHIGSRAQSEAVAMSCSPSSTLVYPGEPVTVKAEAEGLNPKLNTAYLWSGPGVTGSSDTATVATASLAPGSYTVRGEVMEGKAGKDGLKPRKTADCSSSFTVRAYEPPTITCLPNPSTIKPGETSIITATGVSPQNLPLTYNYSAASGTVSGSGATATFSSTGAPTGTVGIICNVTDETGQTATAKTNVTITVPYVPPVQHSQALCSIGFATDKKRPTRVSNEAKACLDEVALDLQKQPDAKAVVVGESDTKEKAKATQEELPTKKHKQLKVEQLAAERAVNAKDYLVTEKGIDASRISVATGKVDGQTAEDYLVPSGASFTADVAGTSQVDESAIKAQARKPLATKPAHKKGTSK